MSAALLGFGADGERHVVPRELWGLYATLFIEILGASLTIPVFSYFCMQELKLSAFHVGIITSGFNAAQLLGAPIWGRISDANGRRGVLLCCFLWTAVCFAATSFVRTFAEMVFVRTLAGLSGGSIPVSQAMIVDASTHETRPLLLGVTGACLGVAFTLGPGMVTLAFYVTTVDRRWVFVAAAFFALLGCVVGACVLQETLPVEKRRPLCSKPPTAADGQSEKARGCGGQLAEIHEVASIGLTCVWLGRFFISFSFLCLFSTYAFLIRDAFGWGDREFGLIIVSTGGFGAATQLLLYPRSSKILGKHAVCSAGCALVTIFFLLLPAVTIDDPSPTLHVLVMLPFCIGSSLVDPGIPDLVGFHAPETHMGLAQGLTSGARSVASMLAPLVAGKAYDANPRLAFYIAAVAALIATLCLAIAPALEALPVKGLQSKEAAESSALTNGRAPSYGA